MDFLTFWILRNNPEKNLSFPPLPHLRKSKLLYMGRERGLDVDTRVWGWGGGTAHAGVRVWGWGGGTAHAGVCVSDSPILAHSV